MRRVFIGLSVLVLLGSSPAHARPDDQGRPFARGTVIPRIGLGFGISPELLTIGWTAGAGYFVANGLELGGSVGGTHLIFGQDLRAAYPGIAAKLPGALVEFTPQLRYLFFRSQWFSPYAFAGVGPTILTNNAPAPIIAHWTAGPGVFIGLGRNLFLDIAVRFSGRFPGQTCTEAFTDVFATSEGPVLLELGGLCGFRWSPSFGLGFSF